MDGAGDDDDGSGGKTSGDKLLRACLMWEIEGCADDSIEMDDLVLGRVVFSVDEGRIKGGVEPEVVPTRSASDEGPEGR